MRALWWLEPGRVGGMARPGYNKTRWLELSFEERVVWAWVGKVVDGRGSWRDYRDHVAGFGPAVARYGGVDAAEAERRLRELEEPRRLGAVLDALAARTEVLEGWSWEGEGDDATLRVEPHLARLERELDALEQLGVRAIVSLLERPHFHERVARRFTVHHFPVPDLGPPARSQLEAFAALLEGCGRAGEPVVTHCLAGIGRTSTMLIAARVLSGTPLREALAAVQARNPAFLPMDGQRELLEGLERQRLAR